MKITGLHLLLTYQCTFECDQCFVWGSPKQSGVMTLQDIRRILAQAGALGTVKSIYFEGGEPFLYYAVLLDLCDEVAEALQRPIDDISVEMVARSLYFYVLAVDQGYAGSAAKYFAENAKLLGIVKRDRSSKAVSVLTQVSLALDQDLTESRKT